MRSLCLGISALILATASFVAAQTRSPHQALLNAALAKEPAIVKATIQGSPLVETYFQFYRSPNSAPIRDHYSLSKLTAAKAKAKLPLGEKQFLTPSRVSLWKRSLHDAKRMAWNTREQLIMPSFVDMISPDVKGFTTKNYTFHYAKTAFLGDRRVVAFDVTPRAKQHHDSHFEGRIWVDQQDKVIIRFTGVFLTHSPKGHPKYLHFDSWRKESKGQWLPYAIYIQDWIEGKLVRGQVRLWGYNARKIAEDDDSTNVAIHVANAQDDSERSVDVSPLQALLNWRNQAQENVLDRLEQAGLLAEPGPFEKVLDQVVTNLEVPNNLNFSQPVEVRILLTLPIEATVLNHTILLSKGLLDTMPDEESLASVLALELGQIELGHHLNTMFAFNDLMIFKDPATYMHMRFTHTAADNKAAAKLAGKYLANSMYKSKLADVADYYAVLTAREKGLKSLTHGYLGDSLFAPDGKPWITAALPATTLKQALAYPLEDPTALSSTLAVNPTTDVLTQVRPRLAPSTLEGPHSLEVLPTWLDYKLN